MVPTLGCTQVVRSQSQVNSNLPAKLSLQLVWTELLQMSPVKIDGAKRQLFSLIQSHNTKLLEAAQKKKKAPALAVPPDAAEAAAEPLKTDAAEAGVEEEGGPEQSAAVGPKQKKTLQAKKEKGGPVKAEGGRSLGQTMKRKRKDDPDTKVSRITDGLPTC